MRHHYPGTWYLDTAVDLVDYPALTRSLPVEVCVVGAGLAGLTTSLELLRMGKSVALLETNRIAWGASGRNAGFVSPGFAEETEKIVSRCGLERAQRLYRYSQAGVDYVRNLVESVDPGIKLGEGLIEACRSNHPAVNAQNTTWFNETFGQSNVFLPEEKTRELLDTTRYRKSVFDAAGFHIHPLNYAHALATLVRNHGGEIFENAPALDIRKSSGGFVVSTPGGKIKARQIVLCTSAYDFRLFRQLSRALLPVATHVVVTEPLNPALNPIHTPAGVSDTRRAGDYYRLVGGNRLMWGGKITTNPRPPRNLDSIMRRTMRSVYSQLGDIGIDYRWSGLMAYCIHKMPIIGEIQPGIWAATGFGGHGVNTTAMAGILVASAIAQGDQRWRDFSLYSPRWAGGSVGRTGVQLSYWTMQTRDWLDEKLG